MLSIFSCSKDDIDAATLKEFEGSDIQPEILRTNNGELSIRYITIREAGPDKPIVIFVHGAPGGLDNYYDYFKDQTFIRDFNVVAIDRLGYGGSNRGKAEPSVERQAESVYPIIDMALSDSQPVILVGHSFGGPIIAKIAMERPNDITGLIFLAPAIDPELEKFEWAGKLGCSVPTKWVTPKDMETAAVEKTNHVAELRKLDGDWKKIKCRTIYAHGTSDGIVPYENMRFAELKLAHVGINLVTIHKGNHFIPFQKPDLVMRFARDLTN